MKFGIDAGQNQGIFEWKIRYLHAFLGFGVMVSFRFCHSCFSLQSVCLGRVLWDSCNPWDFHCAISIAKFLGAPRTWDGTCGRFLWLPGNWTLVPYPTQPNPLPWRSRKTGLAQHHLSVKGNLNVLAPPHPNPILNNWHDYTRGFPLASKNAIPKWIHLRLNQGFVQCVFISRGSNNFIINPCDPCPIVR